MENQESLLNTDRLTSLITLIKTETRPDLDILTRKIIKDCLLQERDLKKIYDSFTFVYDNIYHEIMFKKIHISKQTIRVLEALAMPIANRNVIDSLLKKL